LWGCPHSDPAVELRWGIHTVGWWGMTETISQCIVGYRHLTNRPGTMGSAAPEYEIAVQHPDGRPVSTGETGRLLVRGVRGVSMFKEYLNDPETTAASFDEQGWFDTGDMITLTASGQFQFADRHKDVLKVGGENVSASEVERVILGVPGVAETAVVGRPHDMLDEVPVAFVIAANNADKSLADAILAQCSAQLARFKVPTEILFVEDFSRAALNKIDKTALRARLRNAASPDA
jgi:crotonobetaine/carnitine-CoA ligase